MPLTGQDGGIRWGTSVFCSHSAADKKVSGVYERRQAVRWDGSADLMRKTRPYPLIVLQTACLYPRVVHQVTARASSSRALEIKRNSLGYGTSSTRIR